MTRDESIAAGIEKCAAKRQRNRERVAALHAKEITGKQTRDDLNAAIKKLERKLDGACYYPTRDDLKAEIRKLERKLRDTIRDAKLPPEETPQGKYVHFVAAGLPSLGQKR